MVESWLEGKNKLNNLERSVSAYHLDARLEQQKAVQETIEEIHKTGDSLVHGGFLQFLDNHLSYEPGELTLTEKEALYSTIKHLSDLFGTNSFVAVYREWKNQQNLKQLRQNE